MMNGDESKRHVEKELFSDYELKYKIIPTKELNDRVLEDKEEFYYLMYVKSSSFKYVSVVNSRTGECIYSKFNTGAYNLKSGDIKDLSKKIKKSVSL
jgi:hypothetical protein